MEEHILIDPYAQEIKTVLFGEGGCVNVSKPRHNYGPKVLERLLLRLWTHPDLLCIHEMERAQFAFDY